VVGVQLVEEGLEIGAELLERDASVVILVCLSKPDADRIGFARTCAERLSRWAQEYLGPGPGRPSGPAIAAPGRTAILIGRAAGDGKADHERRPGGEGARCGHGAAFISDVREA
jgi:hypothetical protein